MLDIVPVILCGGSGTRLWPLSSESCPKQFLSLYDSKTMFQHTLSRVENITDTRRSQIICHRDYRFLVAEQLRTAGQEVAAILLEPCRRNTAPAIAAAALSAMQLEGGDPLLLVMPADHKIGDPAQFESSIRSAVALAEQGFLVTFGVAPTHPETGYGYIKLKPGNHEVPLIEKFVEKPDLDTAERYLSEGEYFWNSGIFLFKASAVLDALTLFEPDIVSAVTTAYTKASAYDYFTELALDSFSLCQDISIDHAVMEKTDQSAMLPLASSWSDLGTWPSLWEECEKDAQGNVINGSAVVLDTHNCMINSTRKTTAVMGIQDAVIVDAPNALLVTTREHASEMKTLHRQLPSETLNSSSAAKTLRPWGYFELVDAGPRFKVKRITVNPMAKLSLQMHHHRAEHWVVVSGSARITIGEESTLLCENQSTYIPVGTLHRLENPGLIPLEIIEIQSGPYLGEDDIVRFEDKYNRA